MPEPVTTEPDEPTLALRARFGCCAQGGSCCCREPGCRLPLLCQCSHRSLLPSDTAAQPEPVTSPAVAPRCSLIDAKGYGCWLLEDHSGVCLPDASGLGAVGGTGPRCRHCGQPLISWPSGTWADTTGMVVCEVSPGSKRFRGHDPSAPTAVPAEILTAEPWPGGKPALAAAAEAIIVRHLAYSYGIGSEESRRAAIALTALEDAAAALGAAAPLIAAQAAAEERERVHGAAQEAIRRIEHLAEAAQELVTSTAAAKERERISQLVGNLAADWAAQGSKLAGKAADSAERGALPERTESVAAQSRTLDACARALVVLAEVIKGNADLTGGEH
jgi:hypothetical protein